MHERLESLKPLLKSGEYEQAAKALKEYRTEFPDDWDGKLMEGIIAQLKGDEETFKRIHDEAQTIIVSHGMEAACIVSSPLWKKYQKNVKRLSAFDYIVFWAILAVMAGGIAYCIKKYQVNAPCIYTIDPFYEKEVVPDTRMLNP